MIQRIHYIALENLEERYTTLMNTIASGVNGVKVYYPANWAPSKINKGEFLDIEKTIEFKAEQILLICKAFQTGEVKDGDWFFIADMFFPGIDAIKYMSELQGINIKIAGINHAGRADETDFVQRLNSWADTIEKGYHEVCDLIFVGSQFHKDKVVKHFNLNPDKVKVTGCIWSSVEAFKLNPFFLDKKDFVIFPHRLAKEKGLDDFIEIAEAMPEKEFIITSSSKKECTIVLPPNVKYLNNLTKTEYYQYLSYAKYYLSTAYQETFGYTLREALLYKCRVVVPDALCYPEQLPAQCLYERGNLEQIKKFLTDDFIAEDFYTTKYDNNFQEMLNEIQNYVYN